MAYILIPATIAVLIFTGSVIFHGSNYSVPTDQPVAQTETQPVKQTYQPNPATSDAEAPFPVDSSRKSETAKPKSKTKSVVEKPAKVVPATPIKVETENQSDAVIANQEDTALLNRLAETSKRIQEDTEQAKRDDAEAKAWLDDFNNRKPDTTTADAINAKQKADAIAAAEKKYQQCRKDLKECVEDGTRIALINLGAASSGSAGKVATRAVSDSCARKYSCK